VELAYPFMAAFIVDLMLGDPPTWPHPIKYMGRVIGLGEQLFYRPRSTSGCRFLFFCLAVTLASVMLILWFLDLTPRWLEAVVLIYLMYSCLAVRSLHTETRQVEAALGRGDLAGARRRLSFLVSRETRQLGPEQVRRGILETVGENISDGVVGPMVYALVLGVPGMLLYKMINTMDSMVGYRNERYLAFGGPAARLDDAANFVPARLCGFLIVISGALLRMDWRRGWRIMWRDHQKAASPNAGWPEAAAAGVLGVQLGGPSTYFGREENKPRIGEADHEFGPADYQHIVRLLYSVSALAAALVFGVLAWTGSGAWGLAGALARLWS
jgi:adenosylcobinamide-phosphate synthase